MWQAYLKKNISTYPFSSDMLKVCFFSEWCVWMSRYPNLIHNIENLALNK